MEDPNTEPLEPQESTAPIETPEPTAAPELEPVGNPDKEVTDPGFSPDEWDLKPETLPERYRPVAEKLDTHYSKTLKEHQEEIERLSRKLEEDQETRQLYREMIEAREDPRVAKLSSKVETFETDAKTLIEERDTYRKQLEEIQAKAAEEAEKEMLAKYEEYKKQNSWIFEDDKVLDQARGLLEEGWSTTSIPEVLKLPEEQQAFVREKLSANPQAEAEILELAKVRAENQAPKVANLVGGADTPTITSPPTEPPVSSTTRPDDSLVAAERAVAKHRSKKRR